MCFDKDQYPKLLKQFEATVQEGSVVDYLVEFELLAHGHLFYNQNYDETYSITRFVAGLQENI